MLSIRHFLSCFLFLNRFCKLFNGKNAACHRLPSNITSFKTRMFLIGVETNNSIFTQKSSSVNLLWNSHFASAVCSSWSSLSREGCVFYLFTFLASFSIEVLGFFFLWIWEILLHIDDINPISVIFIANIFSSFQWHFISHMVHFFHHSEMFKFSTLKYVFYVSIFLIVDIPSKALNHIYI